MIAGPKCPKCGSKDTETLIQIGNRLDNECFSCQSFWVSGPPAEIIHTDPLRHWAETGEEI